MQKEVDEHIFVTPVSKVHERAASATRVCKSSLKTIKEEKLNLQAGATTYNTHKKKNKPAPTIYHILILCLNCKCLHINQNGRLNSVMNGNTFMVNRIFPPPP